VYKQSNRPNWKGGSAGGLIYGTEEIKLAGSPRSAGQGKRIFEGKTKYNSQMTEGKTERSQFIARLFQAAKKACGSEIR